MKAAKASKKAQKHRKPAGKVESAEDTAGQDDSENRPPVAKAAPAKKEAAKASAKAPTKARRRRAAESSDEDDSFAHGSEDEGTREDAPAKGNPASSRSRPRRVLAEPASDDELLI
jgi:hypothetical protein